MDGSSSVAVATGGGRDDGAGREGSRRRERVADLAARLVTGFYAVSAVASLAMATSSALLERADRLPELLTPAVFAVGWPSFGYATLALLLWRSLRRRKRAAWWTALVSCAVATVGAGGLSLTFDDATLLSACAVNALVATALLLSRRRFCVRPNPTHVRAAMGLLGLLVLVWLVAGTTVVALTDTGGGSTLDHLLYACTVSTVSVETFTQVPPAVVVPDGIDLLLNVAGAALVLGAVVVLLRPRVDAAVLGADEEDLRGLLARHGDGDSLGYFALRRDKSAVFAPGGKAAVVHRAVGSVCLAAGDPVGNPDAWPAAIEAWAAVAADHGWTPAVMGASEAGAAAYHRAGLQVLEIGDEAVVEVAGFSLEGRAVRGLRQAVGRLERAGTRVEVVRQRDLDAAGVAEVAEVADRWREGPERGFSMALGRIGDPADPDLVVARCRDAQGRVLAVLTFVPWGSRGLSLDVMRRDPQAPNGTTEATVTGVLRACPSLGVERVSLNFAVFRSVFERGSRLGAGPVLHRWYRLLVLASRWWQLEQLYRANAKYQPQWFPRYLCFRRPGDLPEVGLAVAQAEGLLPGPLNAVAGVTTGSVRRPRATSEGTATSEEAGTWT